MLLEIFESGILGVERHPPGLAVPAIARQLVEQRELGKSMLLAEACVLLAEAFVLLAEGFVLQAQACVTGG